MNDEQKERIYLEYHKKVLGYLSSKLFNKSEAEDIASDIFVKVYENFDKYDEKKASISTWIYTITKNTLTDYFRTHKQFEEMPDIPDESISVEDKICNDDMLDKLAKALETLRGRERELIILRYYENKSLKEIADYLNISYSYAKIMQNKAMDKLRDFFDKN